MSKEQIKQIAKDICSSIQAQSYCRDCFDFDKCRIAEAVYNANYRKQREGEWIDQYQGKYANQLYKCSICGDTAFNDDKRWFLTPYCHNCGAKMKGD